MHVVTRDARHRRFRPLDAILVHVVEERFRSAHVHVVQSVIFEERVVVSLTPFATPSVELVRVRAAHRRLRRRAVLLRPPLGAERLERGPEPIELGASKDARIVLVQLADLVRVVPVGHRLEQRVDIPRLRAEISGALLRPLVLVQVAVGAGVRARAAPAAAAEHRAARQTLLLLLEQILLDHLLDRRERVVHLGVVVPQTDGRERALWPRARLVAAEHRLQNKVILKVAQAAVPELVQRGQGVVLGELELLHLLDHALQLDLRCA